MTHSAKCYTCGTEYRRMKEGLNSAKCIEPGCKGTAYRIGQPPREATYRVPQDQFPPMPFPKP